MRLIAYVRVSRLGGRDPDVATSAPEQRKRIKAQAVAQNHTIVGWQEDLDQPGSRYERPGLQAALEAVEAREADGVIVASIDRFARSVPDAAMALRRLEQTGGVLVSVKDALDTSTPVGKFARTMMLALAELELDRIRENWAVVRDRAIDRGVHFAAHVPVGYLRGEGGRLEPDPATSEVIGEMFSRRAEGESWTALCQFLDERIRPPRGKTWTRQTVSSIVQNPAYLGEARAGNAHNPDAHPPLVDRMTWERAQPGQRTSTSRGKALLSGVLRCQSCGRPMTSAAQDQRGYFNYRCRGRHGDGVCPAPARISALRAETYVEGAFLEMLAANPLKAEAQTATDDLTMALERVEQAEAELHAYRDTSLVSVIGERDFHDGLLVRVHALEAARAELATANTKRDVGVFDVAGDLWPTFTVDERRRILAAAFEGIYVARADRPGQGTRVEDRVRLVWRDRPDEPRVAAA